MSCVNIRGCCIGEGRPKVIIPIVEPTFWKRPPNFPHCAPIVWNGVSIALKVQKTFRLSCTAPRSSVLP
jgi:hypothetical protein